jgi:hypothetical protein
MIPPSHPPVKGSRPRLACLEAALDYAARGWHCVQNHPRTKEPVLRKWQRSASTDPAVLGRWFGSGGYNLGVKMGRQSGLIDVECDTPEAGQELGKLLGEDAPVVPTYRGKRGPHRLFKWTPGLPFPDKAVFKFRGIEFRTGNGGKGAQSLFPPSVHPDGPVYTWLVHPDEADPAPLPAAALEIIRRGLEAEASGKGRRAPALGDGEKIKAPGRNTALTSLAGIVRRRGAVEAEIYAFLAAVNSLRCVPPLDDDEVHEIAHSVAQYPPGRVPILVQKVVIASGRQPRTGHGHITFTAEG